MGRGEASADEHTPTPAPSPISVDGADVMDLHRPPLSSQVQHKRTILHSRPDSMPESCQHLPHRRRWDGRTNAVGARGWREGGTGLFLSAAERTKQGGKRKENKRNGCFMFISGTFVTPWTLCLEQSVINCAANVHINTAVKGWNLNLINHKVSVDWLWLMLLNLYQLLFILYEQTDERQEGGWRWVRL